MQAVYLCEWMDEWMNMEHLSKPNIQRLYMYVWRQRRRTKQRENTHFHIHDEIVSCTCFDLTWLCKKEFNANKLWHRFKWWCRRFISRLFRVNKHAKWKIENRNSKPPTNASAYNRFDCFTWSRHWKCCWQICPFQLEIICFYRLHCISKCNEIEWMQKLKFVSKLTNLAAAEMGEKEWKISFVLRFTLRTALPLLFIYVQLIFSQSVDCYLRECSSVCCGCYCWQTLPTMWKRWTNLLTASI